jgi:hypothetical protein
MSIHMLPQLASLAIPEPARLVLTIFRQLDEFRLDYRQEHLETLAGLLAEKLDPEKADGVLSDALLLDNELRSRSATTFAFFPLEAPTASADEARLVNLLSAMQRGQYRRAAEAAVELEILQTRMLLVLAYRLARRLLEANVDLGAIELRGTPSGGSLPQQHLRRSRPNLRLVQD